MLATPILRAQSSRPAITIVVPAPPGGNIDLTIRKIAPYFAREVGHPVVVANRAGAATQIGTEYVAKAVPDGLTLLAVAPSFVINPYLYPVRYHPFKDFRPIIQLTNETVVLVARATLPFASTDISLMAQRIDKGINCAAVSGPSFVGCAALSAKLPAGRLVSIPYNGVAPALQDLLAGNVDIMFGSIDVFESHILSGKLLKIALAGQHGLPDLPSALGLMAPATMDSVLLERYNEAFNAALLQPVVREHLLQNHQIPTGGSPDAWTLELQHQAKHYQRLFQMPNLNTLNR